MWCCTILEIVPITQPGLSSSLSLLSCEFSSSSSSSCPSSSSSEQARLLRLTPIAFNVASNVVSGFLVVDSAFSTFLICSSSCIIAVAASWARFLATAVSLSTESSIHFSFSFFLKQFVSHLFSTESFLLDHTPRKVPKTRTLSSFNPLLPWFGWWCCDVDFFVNLPYLPAGSGEMFHLGALTLASCIDLVVGRDVGCCKMWTTQRQAASFVSRLVGSINLNKAKSAFWPSLHWE